MSPSGLGGLGGQQQLIPSSEIKMESGVEAIVQQAMANFAPVRGAAKRKASSSASAHAASAAAAAAAVASSTTTSALIAAAALYAAAPMGSASAASSGFTVSSHPQPPSQQQSPTGAIPGIELTKTIKLPFLQTYSVVARRQRRMLQKT
jgi:hypothetical protein